MRIPGLHLNTTPLLMPLYWLALACAPTQVSADDLYHLYQKALTHDMQFAAAQAQQLATAEKEPQSRANLLPDLSVTGGAAWVDAEDSSDYHRNRNNTNAYAVVLTQPLLRWQNVIAHDQSKLLISASELHTEQARQALMLRVARAYFDVLLNQELLITPTYNTHVQHPHTTPTYNTHVQHPRTTPMYNTHVEHPCTTPTYSAHVQHLRTAPMYSTHVQHPCTAPMYNTHVQHPCTTPMYSTHSPQLLYSPSALHSQQISKLAYFDVS